MSRALLRAQGDYLHSPVDDLESCFWVSAWSVFFNKDNAGDQSNEERYMKDDFIKNNKTAAIDCLSTLGYHGKVSNIVQRFQPVLFEWWEKLRVKERAWAKEVLLGEPANADGEYYLPHFHRFALQGVVDVLEVLAEHWDGEISWESWTAAGPPM